MGIDVQIQHENGSKVAEFPDPQNAVSKLVVSQHDNRESVCLRFIDPYGDTTFNQLQLPRLIAEVESVGRRAGDSAMKDIAARLSEFLKSAVELHTYVKFIGD